MVVALLLLAVGEYFGLLREGETSFVTLTQAVVIFGLALLPSIIAYRQQKKEVCCV
jgi:hypothetical protein